MKRFNFSVVTVFAVIVILASCKKDATTSTVVSKVVNDLIADTIHDYSSMGAPIGGTGKFTFYSLERGAIVADTTVASWDLGFKGTTIIINGGTSGDESGGAFVQVGTFADIKAVSPDSVFRVDNAPTYAITKGSGKGWYNYDFPTNLVTAIPGRVLIIRTASGKYAKMEIINYYKGGVTPAGSATNTEKALNERYYKFQYAFQSDGTKNF